MKAFSSILMVALLVTSACEIMPANNIKDCKKQCQESEKPNACNTFCDCIHENCQTLDKCLAEYNQAPKEALQTK